jgi:hypothetical protein
MHPAPKEGDGQMGFFGKTFMGKAKDVLTKGVTGVVNDEARERMPLATSMNNADGTFNRENMAAMQDQARAAMARVANMKVLGRQALGPDVMSGYQKIMEDAFQRQGVMMNMMDDYQKNKMAAAENQASASTASNQAPTASSEVKPPSQAESSSSPFDAGAKSPFDTSSNSPFDSGSKSPFDKESR